MSTELQVVAPDDAQRTAPEAGLLRQVMSWNSELMLVRNTMEAGWVGAAHQHPHQQLVYVVSGELLLTVNGSEERIPAGHSLLVPGGVVHQGRTLVASEVLDIFTPYRADYAPGDMHSPQG